MFDNKKRKKEDHRERMLAYLGSLLKQQVEDEDFRIAKEVAKNEARTLEEERLKEQKFKEAMDSINKHRIDTVNFFYIYKLKKGRGLISNPINRSTEEKRRKRSKRKKKTR